MALLVDNMPAARRLVHVKGNTVKKLAGLLLKGLSVVIPLVLTVWILYWLGAGAESLVATVVRRVVGKELYYPGTGIAIGMLALVAVGMLADLWIGNRVLGWGEALISRIPLVRTIYGGLRDLMKFLATASEHEATGQAVVVDFGDSVRLMGLITLDHNADKPAGVCAGDGTSTVAVYLPMSYQLGGYTVFVPRERVSRVDMSGDDAMAYILTAGMSYGSPASTPSEASAGMRVDES